MAGVTSANGQLAQLNVKVEPRREAEPAVIPLQHTVVRTVREMQRKHKNAIRKLALVCLQMPTFFDEIPCHHLIFLI